MALNLGDIRIGIVDLLGNNPPIYTKVVPKTLKPQKYILIINQAIQPYEIAKGCFEYTSQFTLDLCAVTTHGGNVTGQVDAMHSVIESNIYSLEVPNHIVKNVELVGTTEADITTSTNTINRRLLTYNIWLRDV